MKKLTLIGFLAVLVSLLALGAVSAGQTEPPPPPVGGCPDDFHLHLVMDHDEPHHHRHIGTDDDQNGDGYICARHLDGAHVHIDNNVPLP